MPTLASAAANMVKACVRPLARMGRPPTHLHRRVILNNVSGVLRPVRALVEGERGGGTCIIHAMVACLGMEGM